MKLNNPFAKYVTINTDEVKKDAEKVKVETLKFGKRIKAASTAAAESSKAAWKSYNEPEEFVTELIEELETQEFEEKGYSKASDPVDIIAKNLRNENEKNGVEL